MSAVTLNPTANGTYNLQGTDVAIIAPLEWSPEQLPVFTDAGVDVYSNATQLLTGDVGYSTDLEFDFNPNGVDEVGIYVYAQAYGLQTYTGASTDSLKFPAQAILFDSPRRFLKFPATAGTAWSWSSRRVVDFNLTVGSAGLNNTPGQHIFTVSGSDEIAGWGQMRVNTLNGASAYYNVLIKKNMQQTVDSMFLGGQPAPAMLLSAFGMTQGQVSAVRNRYVVFREGYSTPLALINYANSTFSTPTSIFFDADNHQYTGVDESEIVSGLILYPNPVSGGVLNVVMLGQWAGTVNYEIVDLQGRLVKSGSANNFGGPMAIATDGLTTGNYLLKLIGHDGQTMQERFSVQD